MEDLQTSHKMKVQHLRDEHTKQVGGGERGGRRGEGREEGREGREEGREGERRGKGVWVRGKLICL